MQRADGSCVDLDQLTVAAGIALWTVASLVTAALVLRVLVRPAGRAVWAPAATAALATYLGHLLAAVGAGRLTTAASFGLLVVGATSLAMTVMALMRTHQRVALLRGWLDTLSGLLLAISVTLAAAARPVQRALDLEMAQTSLILAVPACAAFLTLFALTGLRNTGALATAPAQLVLGALVVLAAAESAQLLQRVGVLDASPPIGVHEVGLPLFLVLLATASWTRSPVVVVVDEPARSVMLGPVLQLGIAGALLGVDHAVGLPTATVVLALCVIAISLVCVLLVYRLISSLNGSRQQALTDELTGLGNRRALSAALAGVGSGQALSLTLVDLDRFKEVNDVLGHDAGDELLRQVAARLLASSPADEVVVRQGGDEFALVRPATTAAVAAARAARVVIALEAPFTLGGHQVSVDASMGVAAAPEHTRDAEELQRMADSSMYRAKESRGGVVVYDAEVDAARRAELDLVADLRDAVAHDRLDVHFQPQLEAATGALVGVEALVRWQHPTRGMLGPFAFLPLAERNGLMDAITRQVLRRALVAKPQIDGGSGSRMSVNISATSLLDPYLVTTVGALLLDHGVPPHELMLEITETELMLDAAVSRRVVAELVALGVGVSIDDYGTGHSSLAYLKDLPATELKLDRSFVAELGTDARIATIVRSTVDLAHSLGLRLVAEGVEDAATLDALAALGVDDTQGYHHSRPVPADELARWAARRRVTAPAR